ncbi:hypothetical protein Tco_0119647, partial [Tanacetum coccineum]
TPPSQSTHVDHDPQITKVAAKTAPYVPPIRRCYNDIGLELHNSNAEASNIMRKNLRPKYWNVEKFHKSIIAAIKEEKNQEEEEGQHKNTQKDISRLLLAVEAHKRDTTKNMGSWNHVAQDFKGTP